MVECQPSKLYVVGSNPTICSTFCPAGGFASFTSVGLLNRWGMLTLADSKSVDVKYACGRRWVRFLHPLPLSFSLSFSYDLLNQKENRYANQPSIRR